MFEIIDGLHLNGKSLFNVPQNIGGYVQINEIRIRIYYV